MGGVVDAITGGGSRDAADAQAQAGALSIRDMREALRKALDFQERALRTSQENLQKALDFGEPYRQAGTTALANYESFLYGIPVEQTSAYRSIESQRARASTKNTEIPEGAVKNKDFHKNQKWELGNYQYKKFGDEVLRKPKGGGKFATYTAEDVDRDIPLPGDYTVDENGDPVDNQQFRMDAMMRTPGYQFRVDEGQKALERSAAARSGVLTGRQLKATERYGQDVATAEFDNILRRIGGLVDTGAGAATTGGNQAIGAAGQQTNALGNSANLVYGTGQGTAGAQSQIGAARASGYLGTQAAGANVLNMAGQVAGFTGFGKDYFN